MPTAEMCESRNIDRKTAWLNRIYKHCDHRLKSPGREPWLTGTAGDYYT